MYNGISAACLLSALTAGVVAVLASPVTAKKAAAITISVDRGRQSRPATKSAASGSAHPA